MDKREIIQFIGTKYGAHIQEVFDYYYEYPMQYIRNALKGLRKDKYIYMDMQRFYITTAGMKAYEAKEV